MSTKSIPTQALPATSTLTVSGEDLRGLLTTYGARLYRDTAATHVITFRPLLHVPTGYTEVLEQDIAVGYLRETGADLRFGIHRVTPTEYDRAAALLTAQLRAEITAGLL